MPAGGAASPVYLLTLQTPPSSIHVLRALLKTLLRRYGLHAVDVREVP
jgi:hypothetical protein